MAHLGILGQSGAMPIRMISDQSPYHFDVRAGDCATLDDHSLLHESIIAEKRKEFSFTKIVGGDGGIGAVYPQYINRGQAE